MTNETSTDYIDMWSALDFLDAILSPFTDAMGMAPFTLVIGTVLTLSLYAWSGTFLMPAIVLALFGGLMIAAAPPQAAFIGTMMVVCAITMALLAIRGDA